jgi:hypothetical protein
MGWLWRLAGIGGIGIAVACGGAVAESPGVDAAAEEASPVHRVRDAGGADEGATDEGATDEGATDEGATDAGGAAEGASDAGAAGEGGIDAPEEAVQRFKCGHISGLLCDPTTQICELQHEPVGPPGEECDPIPAQCVSNPTCACIQPVVFDAGLCFESFNGGVTVCWESSTLDCW